MTSIALHDYRIFVGDCLWELSQLLSERSYSRVFVLADQYTHQDCRPVLEPYLSEQPVDWIIIPPGEIHKNLDTCQYIWQQLMDKQADRQSVLLNLGGGVIGDMGGFCAATFKRGIDFIQIPTTLLAQVDASIGGKLGIDFADIKNSVGLFANPQAVFASPQFFGTLPHRELRSGFAEIVKHALIANIDQWKELEELPDLESVNWPEKVVPSLRIKQRIVAQDPSEKGLRKALNFGHTIGHAVESHLLHSKEPLLHGEAIAIGMICESYISFRQTGLPEQSLQSICRFIQRIYKPPALDPGSFDDLIQIMRNDKKNRNRQEINFSLLPAIGRVVVDQTTSLAVIRESLLACNEMVGVN